MARKRAREAGLDKDTADAVAHRVIDRMVPHLNLTTLIDRIIAEHAQP